MMASAIRVLPADAVQQANSGHPGMPLGMADAATDLTGSNLTETSKTGAITADSFAGRYMHYGTREHVMSAVMNGFTHTITKVTA